MRTACRRVDSTASFLVVIQTLICVSTNTLVKIKLFHQDVIRKLIRLGYVRDLPSDPPHYHKRCYTSFTSKHNLSFHSERSASDDDDCTSPIPKRLRSSTQVSGLHFLMVDNNMNPQKCYTSVNVAMQSNKS